MTNGSILVVDDEKGQREIIKAILEGEGYEAATARNAVEAMKAFQNGFFDAVLSDLKMTGEDGIHLLANVLKERPGTAVVIMTGHGTIDSAVEAMKLGAFDYLTKPLEREELLIVVKKAVEKTRLIYENRRLKEQLDERFRVDNIIGSDGKLLEVVKMIKKVSGNNSTVLVYGESGTGKELVARAIHQNSPRKERPFLPINCAAIPLSLLESELFGHEKGAFTGASSRKIGLFEAAAGGTLFLDEIGDMDMGLQAKLLRVLQEKEIRRVGGREGITVDVRIIAATNKDLEEEIRHGRFREDLYYRLNVISFCIPPLRERKGDIPELVGFFIEKHGKALRKKVRGISDEAMDIITRHQWPGNVRQLEAAIERAVIMTDGNVIEADSLPMEIRNRPSPIDRMSFDIPDTGINFEEMEKEILTRAMEKADWVIAKAAPLLGMSYRTLQYRLEKFGIKKGDALH